MFSLDEKEVQNLVPLLYGTSVEKKLLDSINREMNKVGIYYRSFARMKSPESLVAKLKRKNDIYIRENRKLQDIVGVRVVLYFEDDIEICRKIIEEMFDVHEDDCQIDTLGISEFKPERMNLVCTLPPEYARSFPAILWQNYRIDQTFELQIRTILSEGWHEVDHDVRYKHEKEWEKKEYYGFNRELNGVKATLEMCDNSIVHIIERLTYYCYKNNEIEEMIRYKFRIHFKNEHLSGELKAIIDQNLSKELYRADREEVLMCLADKLLTDLPKTMDNLVYICNELQIHDKKIERRTPPLVKEYVVKYRRNKHEILSGYNQKQI